jgi:hypothetical protein
LLDKWLLPPSATSAIKVHKTPAKWAFNAHENQSNYFGMSLIREKWRNFNADFVLSSPKASFIHSSRGLSIDHPPGIVTGSPRQYPEEECFHYKLWARVSSFLFLARAEASHAAEAVFPL